VILSARETESGVSIIDGDLSFERFIELHFCSGEAEALRLGRDLETAAIPLHNIVVANAAFVMKAADVIEVFRSGPPSLLRIAWCATKASVVVGQEAAQNLVGAVQIVGTGQT